MYIYIYIANICQIDKTALPMDQLFSNIQQSFGTASASLLEATDGTGEVARDLLAARRSVTLLCHGAMVPWWLWSLDQHTPWKNHMILLCREWREIPFAHVVVLWNMMIGTQLNTSYPLVNKQLDPENHQFLMETFIFQPHF